MVGNLLSLYAWLLGTLSCEKQACEQLSIRRAWLQPTLHDLTTNSYSSIPFGQLEIGTKGL